MSDPAGSGGKLIDMTQLNVVKASVTEPLLGALPFSQLKIEQMLEQSGLPPAILESQQGLLPLYSAEKFLCRIVTETSELNFNYNSITAQLDDTTEHIANIPLFSGQTGLDAARVFVSNIDQILTGTHFYTRLEGSTFWMLRTTRTTEFSDMWTVVQYNLSVLLTGMQHLFGHTLRPVAVRTGTRASPRVLPEALRDIPIESCVDQTGLGFNVADIVGRTGLPNCTSTRSNTGKDNLLSETRPEEIAACLSHFLSSGVTDNLVGRVAHAFGMSVRTYQRRLAKMQVIHSQLVDYARITAATDLLRDSRKSVLEISMDLGYAHAGDFSRFFRHRIGMSPTQFRALI